MNEQERHSVPVLIHKSFPHQIKEECPIRGQADEQHDGVGCEGDDLSLPKPHIVRKAKV